MTEPEPTPAPNPNPEPSPAPNPEPAPFKVSEEYQEYIDSKNIKSTDDLVKHSFEQNKLIGKKDVPFNYEEATPQQVEEHRASTRPEKKEDYDFFDENTPEDQKSIFQEMFFNHGLSKYEAKSLTESFTEAQNKIIDQKFSKDEFKEMLTQSFPEDTEKVGGGIANFIKKNVKPEIAPIFDSLENKQLMGVYHLINNVMTQYGAKEGDAGAGAGEGSKGSGGDVKEMASKIRGEINALKRRPHTAGEKIDLQNKLTALYKTK